MKRVLIQLLCCIFALCCVVISVCLFWNGLCYADDHGVSVTAMYGGPLFFCLNWLQIALMVLIAALSFSNIFSRKKKKEKAARKEEPPAETLSPQPIPVRPMAPDSAPCAPDSGEGSGPDLTL